MDAQSPMALIIVGQSERAMGAVSTTGIRRHLAAH